MSINVVASLRKRGVRVLPGGDYGFPATPHGTYARDLWLFVKILGFPPMETLVAATPSPTSPSCRTATPCA